MSPPLVGPKPSSPYYQVVGVQPSKLSHKMASGTLGGEIPADALGIKNPEVGPGSAKWENLTKGGLFNFVGKNVVIEEKSVGTWKIGMFKDNVFTETRPVPSTVPFKLCPGEVLSVSGGSECFIIARLDVQRVV